MLAPPTNVAVLSNKARDGFPLGAVGQKSRWNLVEGGRKSTFVSEITITNAITIDMGFTTMKHFM
jgi:hypothetical protein